MKKLFLVVLVGACGDNVVPEVITPPDAPPPWSEAAHGTAPTLVNLGGAVLTTPKIQPIFFTNDATMQASIEAFSTQLAASPYWTTTTAEYGVGPIAQVLPTIVSTDPPPTTEDQLTTWLTAQLDGTHTATGWPATVDPQTVYSLFTPQGVVVTSPNGDSCSSYGAYHDELTGAHGESIVYAFMPRCADLDDLTVGFSHELIEAATDPYVNSAPAFGDADVDNYIMAITPGAETGDYCEYLDSAAQRIVGNFLVQRTWSNAASLAGKDPCVPAATAPYVAGVPMFTDHLRVDGYNGPVQTRGVSVPLHMTKTVDIQLISDVPTDLFQVRAVDIATLYGSPQELTFTWDLDHGKNGDVIHLTIMRVRAGQLPGSEFYIEGRMGSQPISMWWGYAAN
jgi:hypothetical protein